MKSPAVTSKSALWRKRRVEGHPNLLISRDLPTECREMRRLKRYIHILERPKRFWTLGRLSGTYLKPLLSKNIFPSKKRGWRTGFLFILKLIWLITGIVHLQCLSSREDIASEIPLRWWLRRLGFRADNEFWGRKRPLWLSLTKELLSFRIIIHVLVK